MVFLVHGALVENPKLGLQLDTQRKGGRDDVGMLCGLGRSLCIGYLGLFL